MSVSQARPAWSYYLGNLLRLVQEIDWWLAMAAAFLLLVSLSVLQSAGGGGIFYEKQLEFAWVGVAAAFAFWRLPYPIWTTGVMVPVLYLVNLALLLAVMVAGHAALGAQRWLSLGPFTLQPSEIAKLVVIFTLAAWFSRRPVKGFFDIFKAGLIILPPAALVFKQPDLGTSLTFAAVFIAMTYWAGATVDDIIVLMSPLTSLVINALDLKTWHIYLAALAVVLILTWRRRHWVFWQRLLMCALVVSANFAAGDLRPHLWGALKEYQQKRLTSFVNPYADPRGSGYHILQSLIAIGAGGMTGAGIGRGNQSQGAFIPERHTDFIFAVVGEELGFRLSVLVILAYGIICLRAVVIAYRGRVEPGGSLIATGVMAMILFHAFLNIGMTMGIMPVAGVPLPLVSYGGTALIVDLIGIGLLMSVSTFSPGARVRH